jgi:hypothetical protein
MAMHISPLSSEHLLIRCAQEEPGSPQQTVILLEGRIDEYCRLEALPAHVEGDCILDLGGVQFINSVGLRKWIQMMRGFAGRVDRLRLRGMRPRGHPAPPARRERRSPGPG